MVQRMLQYGNIEHHKVLEQECPIHHDDVDGHYDTECWEKAYDCKIAVWLNGWDLDKLKTIAHNEKTNCRDLLTEAMHDLFEKHGLVIVRGCDKCGNGNGNDKDKRMKRG